MNSQLSVRLNLYNFQVGCENVHIDCAATDVNWVKRWYREGGWDLQEAKECLDTKCQRRTDGRYVNRST